MNDSSLPQGTRPTLALSVTGLTKHYDSGFTLDDVTFDLPSGYIMGLVGPNGAGKSTLIKLILNMTTRDAGRIEVLGLDAMADEERAKEQLGVVLDSSYFIEYMTVDAVERTSSPMYPLWDHNLFDAYLRRFGLGRNKKIKDLSRGMQMKLMLAVALSHDAKLLILDEPTSGLDPRARLEMKALFKELRRMGKTILISSHILSELADCCTSIGIIERGQLLMHGPIEDVYRRIRGNRIVQVRFHGPMDAGLSIIRSSPACRDVQIEDRQVTVELETDDAGVAELLQQLVRQNVPIRSYAEKDPTLEDVFMLVTKGLVS